MATVTLDDHLERLAWAQVESGRYGSIEEVVEAALRLLQEQVAEEVEVSIELDRMLQAGVDSADAGRVHSADDVFDEVEARLRKRIAEGEADAGPVLGRRQG